MFKTNFPNQNKFYFQNVSRHINIHLHIHIAVIPGNQKTKELPTRSIMASRSRQRRCSFQGAETEQIPLQSHSEAGRKVQPKTSSSWLKNRQRPNCGRLWIREHKRNAPK